MWIGSVGWQHAHWQESFYPETLPEDWWLTYYSNEFRCVLMPAAHASPDAASDWLANTHDRFRFFLSLDAGADDERARALAQALGERLGGVVWTGAPAPGAAGGTGQRWADLGVPLAIDAGPEHPWRAAGLAQGLWKPERPAAGSALGLAALADAGDRRTLRDHVERFGRQATEAGVAEPALFFDGPRLRADTLRDAAVIAGLLGL